MLPGDDVGVEAGLKVTEDYLGSPIIGPPDMGAFEM